jgi:cadmium resistance protein CadD (predicted permease)
VLNGRRFLQLTRLFKSIFVRLLHIGRMVEWAKRILLRPLGSLIPLLVPPYFIGLLGIVPMAIGAKRLVQIIRKDGNTSIITRKSNNIHRPYLPFFGSSSYNLFKRWGQYRDIYSFVRTV